ncbi:hypothetical protein HPB50_016050 [Hyalomma asiaticum]|uniref:Uncharacterized protein n=1 Tax=Hyalomma asiaticum TaxID=266040 RepID=A0ACB7SHL8_HYAAI|nr:hypothetical protein HPB50_016050 [Hyalomma asiaticum]
MRAICYSRDTSTVAEKTFWCYKHLAAQTTEFWWMQLLLRLRSRSPHRKDAVQADAGGYQVLGDVRLPDEVAHLLKKGPKFSTEPSIPAHELLALNRRISRKAVLEDQERCLLDGVDSLRRTVTKNSPTSSALIKKTVSFFKENELRLLLSDKEGNFVVAPSAVFKEKAIWAVNKNFIPSTVKALKAQGSSLDGIHVSKDKPHDLEKDNISEQVHQTDHSYSSRESPRTKPKQLGV